MAGDAQERTEEATPRKRDQARKKGTVAKSMDLTGSLVLLALILMLPLAIGNIAHGFVLGLQGGWARILTEPSPAAMGAAAMSAFQPVAPGLVMLIATAMGIGLVSNFGQVGFVLSGEALNPRLDRLNPAAGIKRMFSFGATFEGLKAFGKSLVFGWLAFSAMTSNWDQILRLAWLPPMAAMSAIGLIVRSMAIRIGMAWLSLAALDYFFQRKRIDKELRMSKEEVKQEMKEMEQSPELRMAIARRRRQLSKRMMSAVKTADVIITNPTHYSIAIKYELGKSHAPQVVAKGMDHLAFKIREVATEAKVPIVPNPPLARALYKHCEIGDFVPRDYFQPVAEVLAYVYKTVKGVRKRAS